jgi:hypothetical protein
MTGAGSTDLRRHLAGESLTLSEAVKAKCCDCMAGYVDGRISCELKECPLWPYMPYNPSRRHFRQGKSPAGTITQAGGDMAGLVELEGMA